MLKESAVLKIGGRVAKAIKAKKELKKLPELINSLREKIKNVDWKELHVELIDSGNTFTYEVSLPKKLMRDFDKLEKKIESLGEFKEVGNDLLWGGDTAECDKFTITMQVRESMFNKIDISGYGLPIAFRSLGLGKKIYKKIISEVGYISSENHGSYKYSHLLWSSLIKDEDIYTFMNNNWILAFLKDQKPDVIIERLEKFFQHNAKNDCVLDESFIKANRNLFMPKLQHLL